MADLKHGRGDEMVLTRTFDAPPSLVFRAWTEPSHFQRWWGPTEFTTPHCTIDLRPGGHLRFCMRGPDGAEYWCAGVYREVAAPGRLACTSYFCDRAGNRVDPAQYGMADWPAETVMTVTFEDVPGGKTAFTLHETVSAELARTYQAPDGWGQSFDKLAAYLPEMAAQTGKRWRGEA